MTSTPSLRKPWLAIIGIVVAAGSVIAITLQMQQLWEAQAPSMPSDVSTLERVVSLAEALDKHSKSVSVPLVQLLVTTERDKRVPLYREIDEASAKTENDMRELAKIIGSSHDSALYKSLEDKRMRYRELFLAAVDELETIGAKGTLEQFWTPTREALDALELSSKQLADGERAKLEKLHEAKNSYTAATQRLTLLLAALIVLSVCIGALLVHCWSIAAGNKKS